jgi:hypothetical protein
MFVTFVAKLKYLEEMFYEYLNIINFIRIIYHYINHKIIMIFKIKLYSVPQQKEITIFLYIIFQ